MHPTDTTLLSLMQHEHWANVRIARWLLTLPVIPDRAKSLFDHIIAAHDNWWARIAQSTPSLTTWTANLQPEQYEKLLERYHRQWMDWLMRTGASGNITYQNLRGESFTHDAASIIIHLSLHAQYHRGQITEHLRASAEPPPPTDFIVWARQQGN